MGEGLVTEDQVIGRFQKPMLHKITHTSWNGPETPYLMGQRNPCKPYEVK
jgi:hypothetical protein